MRNLLLSLGLLFLTQIAMADEKGPCSGDAVKFCAGVSFGGGKVFECLIDKLQEVSVVCRAHLRGMAEYKTDCRKEIKRYCSGKAFYCLLYPSGFQKDVSKGCLKRITQNASYLDDCPEEIKTSCQSHLHAPWAMVDCLKKMNAALSEKCRDSLNK